MDRELSTFSRGRSPSPRPAAAAAAKPATTAFDVQREVDEITDIMRINMQNIVNREVKLNELHGRADTLNEKSKIFEKATKKLENKYWWKNTKWMVIGGVAGLILILIIALCIVFAFM